MPEDTFNLFSVWWAVAGLSAFGLIWLVRLESQVLFLKEANKTRETLDVAKLSVDSERDKAIWQKFELLQTSLNQINVTMARLSTIIERSDKNH